MNRQLYCCFFLQKHSKTSIISGVQAEERRSKIVNYLRDNEFCSLEELSRMLNVSVSTVRRDVNCLSLEGYLRRTHGGAQMILNQPANMLAVVDLPNNAVHSDTKMAIARYCASLILPGQTIIMDAGSTVYYVAQQLVSKHPIVVTNSLPISNLYSGYSQVETHVVGGVIYPRLGVLTGPKAEEGFASIHADVAIMGAAGLTLNEGLTNTHALLIDMQLTMIRSARKVFFCMDSTKLGNSSLFYLCKTDKIQNLITDERADPTMVEALREKGVNVYLAPISH